MANVNENLKNLNGFTRDKTTSKDGTIIGYQSIGKGPGIIVLHGVLSTSEDFTRLAEELSDSFTVHIIDRRGRGMSGPQGEQYSIEKECEDVKAVQAATGSTCVFGHSFGGFLALEAARRNISFDKMVLYEPGVSINNSIAMDWVPAFEKAMNKNDYLGAFVYFSRPHVKALQLMPFWLAKMMMRKAMKPEFLDKVQNLLPTIVREHREEQILDSTYDNYSVIRSKVLLLSGEKSEKWAHQAVETVEKTITGAKLIMLPDLDHLAPDNNYSPQRVAQNVKEFFLSD